MFQMPLAMYDLQKKKKKLNQTVKYRTGHRGTLDMKSIYVIKSCIRCFVHLKKEIIYYLQFNFSMFFVLYDHFVNVLFYCVIVVWLLHL